MPIFFVHATVGRVLGSAGQTGIEPEQIATVMPSDSYTSVPRQRSSSPVSVDDFEILEKSIDEFGQAKSSSAQGSERSNKRKNKKS